MKYRILNYREKPFALIVVLNGSGNAEGDLFYDDGESIDTISTKSYYYATYKWSTVDARFIINVVENNYPAMSNKILDTLIIYGLDHVPDSMTVNDKEFQPKIREKTQIVYVTKLGLTMTQNYIFTWSNTSSTRVSGSSSPAEPKAQYRVDCHPDAGNTK